METLIESERIFVKTHFFFFQRVLSMLAKTWASTADQTETLTSNKRYVVSSCIGMMK